MPANTDVSTAARANVLLQLEHLANYPVVREKIEHEGLQLHGWFYDIPTGELSVWSPDERQWVSVTVPGADHPLAAPVAPEEPSREMPPSGAGEVPA